MKFSDEYKKEMRSFDPDEETLARMKAAVMNAVKQKKPRNALPLAKRVAVFGGSAAACALIAVCAVKLAPVLTKSNKIVADETQSSVSCAEAPESFAPDSAAADLAENDKSGGFFIAEDCTIAGEGGQSADSPAFEAPIFSLSTDEIESEAADELPPDNADTAANSADGGNTTAPAATTAKTEPAAESPDNGIAPDSSDLDSGAGDKLPDNGGFIEPTRFTEEAAAETSEWFDSETECEAECSTECVTEEAFDESSEEYEDNSVEAEEAEPNDGGVNAEMFGEGYVSTVIEISADGKTVWVYGDGEHKSKGRYMRISTTERGGDGLPSAVLLNTTDGLHYLVKLEKGAPNCIYITDSAGNLLGKYRKNG